MCVYRCWWTVLLIFYCVDVASFISCSFWKSWGDSPHVILPSQRDWADKCAPKIVEQARLETTTCSATSISCAQVIALGKRLYNKTLITLEAQGSNWEKNNIRVITILLQKSVHGQSTLQVCQRGNGRSFKCFHMHIATKECPCHVSSNSTPSNTNSKVQQSRWWLQSQVLMAHNTLNDNISPDERGVASRTRLYYYIGIYGIKSNLANNFQWSL